MINHGIQHVWPCLAKMFRPKFELFISFFPFVPHFSHVFPSLLHLPPRPSFAPLGLGLPSKPPPSCAENHQQLSVNQEGVIWQLLYLSSKVLLKSQKSPPMVVSTLECFPLKS